MSAVPAWTTSPTPTGLDRNEVGALLVASGLGRPAERQLVSLLAINGLRVSEALCANIDNLGLERGHRTLTVLRKGGKIVIIPLAPGLPEPSAWPSVSVSTGRSSTTAAGTGSTGSPPRGSSAAWPARPGSPGRSALTHCSAFHTR